jgi:hypothetical protein
MSDRHQVEVDEHEEIVGRVAAIDVAKASAMVCTRVPHATKAGQRVTTVWQVPSTTNQVLELAEQLAGEGIQRVVVESTSDYWRPFVSVLEARGRSCPARRGTWWRSGADQAAASSLAGVTAGMVASSAVRRAGRWRWPLTRRNWRRASPMPAAIQRSTIWPSCQRLTLAA